MTVLHNRDRWEPSNALVRDGSSSRTRRSPGRLTPSTSTTGCCCSARARGTVEPDEAFDLAEVLAGLVVDRQLTAFEVDARFHDIGTPEALRETESFLSRTPPAAR